MGYQFNPFTGNLDIVGDGGGGGGGGGDITAVTAGTGLSGGGTSGSVTLSLANTAVAAGSYTYGSFTVDAQGRITSASSGTTPVTAPAGSDTQIQVNDGGVFAGFIELLWNKITKVFTVKGDVRLDDGGTYTTTLQVVTPTANRTISYPDATGTLALVAGSSGQAIYNNGGALAGISTMTFDGTSVTLAGRLINSYTSVASAPAKIFTGTWFTGGTATTTKPHFLIEPTGATSTTWNPSGTGLGVNAASGFAGNLLDLQVNGSSQFTVNNSGSIGNNNVRLALQTTHLEFVYAGTVRGIAGVDDGAATFKLPNTGFFGWASSITVTATYDLALFRDGANTLAQRNGTNAQIFRCYGTYTDASNYVRAALSSTSTGVTLAAETAGTGADDIPLNLTAAGTGTVKINSVAEVAVSSTVAGLPTAPTVGMMTRVTDATAPAVGSTVTGGGAAAALVWYNGASWTVLGV